MLLARAPVMFCGIMSTTKKAATIKLIQNVIWMFWQMSSWGWCVTGPLWLCWCFLSFISSAHAAFLWLNLKVQGIEEAKTAEVRKQRKSEDVRETKGWQWWGEDKTKGKTEAKWKIRMKGREEENKEKWERVRCGPFISRRLRGNCKGQHTCYYSLQRK